MKKELVLSLCIAIAGCALTFGVCKNQIDNNKKNIEKLELTHKEDIAKIELTHEKDISAVNSRQNNQDALLQSINNNLAELNTKMDLLVAGKLKQGE